MSNRMNSNAVVNETNLEVKLREKQGFYQPSNCKVDYITSTKQNIEGLDGAQWWLTFHLLPWNYASVNLHVSKYVVKARGTITNSFIKDDFDVSEIDGSCCIVERICLREEYAVSCTVRFEGLCDAIKIPTFNDAISSASHYPTDTDVVVGNSTLNTHRYFLRTISPVFNACFANDSKEAQTGVLKIDDFKFETVKNAIDYCHGRDVPTLSVEDAIDVLRFADKYDIKFVVTNFEGALFAGLNYASFNPIAQYAWKFERKDLKLRCHKYYKDNVLKLVLDKKFLALPTAIRDEIMLDALPAEDA